MAAFKHAIDQKNRSKADASATATADAIRQKMRAKDLSISVDTTWFVLFPVSHFEPDRTNHAFLKNCPETISVIRGRMDFQSVRKKTDWKSILRFAKPHITPGQLLSIAIVIAS